VTFETDGFRVAPLRYEDSPSQTWTIDPSFFPSAEQYSAKFFWHSDRVAAALPSADAIETAASLATSFSESRSFATELFSTPKGDALYVEPRIRDRTQEALHNNDEEPVELSVDGVARSDENFLISTHSEYGAT